jgi:hypothetical protein
MRRSFDEPMPLDEMIKSLKAMRHMASGTVIVYLNQPRTRFTPWGIRMDPDGNVIIDVASTDTDSK